MERIQHHTEEIITDSPLHPSHIVHTTERIIPPTVPLEHPIETYKKKKTIFRFYQMIWYFLGIIEVVLLFRMLLKSLGANPFTGFTAFIYAVSTPFALPFQGILPATVNGISVIEWSTIIAAVVYFIIAYGLIQAFQMVKPVTPEEIEQSVDVA